MRSGAALCVTFALAGCASPGHLPPPAAPLVWPSPPEPARIALASEFHGPRDLSINPGFFRRVVSLIFGGTEDLFVRPYAVAVLGDAPAGPSRIAVTDIEAKAVHLLDLDGGSYVRITEAGEDGPFVSPVGAAFDGAGRVYVVDSTKRLLVRYTAEGELDRVLGRAFSRPTGVAIDAKRGVVYVSDPIAHSVFRFDLDGHPLAVPTVPLPFDGPTHLAVDRSGQLLVSDGLAFHVSVVSPEGVLLGTVGQLGDSSGELSRPKGVAADSEGHVYVADALFDNVQIFDLEGRFLLPFGTAGDAPGELALPAGVAIDARDLVYVADAWNGRVQVFRYVKGEAVK
jgi:DNA-binding beta-propeller fold protein YncE